MEEYDIQEAYEIATVKSNQSAQYNKECYDQHTFGKVIIVGERILLRNLSGSGGTGKRSSFFWSEIYTVIEKDPSVPVFIIENGNDKKKVMYNVLFKYDGFQIQNKNLTPKWKTCKFKTKSHCQTNFNY